MKFVQGQRLRCLLMFCHATPATPATPNKVRANSYDSGGAHRKISCVRENEITKSNSSLFLQTSQPLILWHDGLLVIVLIRELNKKKQAIFSARKKRPSIETNELKTKRADYIFSMIFNKFFGLKITSQALKG